MFEGTVISINIAPAAAAPMQSVNEARAVPDVAWKVIVITISREPFQSRNPIANSP